MVFTVGEVVFVTPRKIKSYDEIKLICYGQDKMGFFYLVWCQISIHHSNQLWFTQETLDPVVLIYDCGLSSADLFKYMMTSYDIISCTTQFS